MSTWHVRYDGPCSKCGTILRAGEPAVWVRGANRMECIVCPAVAAAVSPPPPIERGVAGASARRKHETLLARREAELKEQWGDRVGGWINKLSDEPQSTLAWARGAGGEEKLEAALADVPGIEALHDRRIPGSKANIDHIVVAPAGVFVVDSKRYQGQIKVRRTGSFFHPVDRLYVGGRDRTKDVDGVKRQVAIVEEAILAASLDPKPTIVPVLCFIDGEWPWFGAASSFDGVYLESQQSIRKLLLRSADYAPGEIDRFARMLAASFPPK